MNILAPVKGFGMVFGLLTMLLCASPVQADDAAKVTNVSTGTTYTDLQAAINAANPGDTLKLKGHFNGPFSISKSLTLIGSPNAVLDGNNTVRVLDLGAAPNAIVNLENLTIQNGVADTGGGIFTIAALTLRHVVVTYNNSTGEGGGGIANWLTNPDTSVTGFGSLTIIDSEISHNTTLGEGGGILTEGGTLSVECSRINDNFAQAFGGGVALCVSTNTFRNTLFTGNTSLTFGGGLADDRGAVTILNCVAFKENNADSGGGLYQGNISIIINNSTFVKNFATTSGGGIYISGIATLNDSEILENEAGVSGGGLFSTSGASIVIKHTEIEDNTPNDIQD